MKMRYILFAVIVAVTFSSCEDIIELDLDNGKNQLVVDGFLNNEGSIQTIRLTFSAPYFSNVATPFENGASVRLIGYNNLTYNFISDGNGNYEYNPNTLGAIDSIGFNYKLEIDYEGSTYTSTSVLNPVPVIDSMPYAFEPSGFGTEEGYYAQFYARDFGGRKDFYWIKPFRNGKPVYDDPTSMILSEDATFGGEAGDGLVFIKPFRAIITDESNPFVLGDTSSVELHSLNSSAYQFLDQLVNSSGNDGLFAVPPSNIRSNIFDATGNPQDEVLGLFSLSAISKFEVIIQ